ncbi:MAG: hypothetical protein DBX59_00985 [Bacillota bacterium]|nr:MAG: hypothetical protein DBX59_00985 [Bacillota bacterium]
MHKSVSLTRRLLALLMTLALLGGLMLPAVSAEEAAEPETEIATSIWQIPEPEEEVVDPNNPVPEAGEEAAAVYAANAESGVLYNLLNNNQKAAYRAFLIACEDVVNCGMGTVDPSLNVSRQEAILGVTAAMYDHPEVFWHGGRYALYYNGNGQLVGLGMSRNGRWYTTAAQLAQGKQEFEDAANRVLAQVDTSDGAAMTALRIHDALAAAVTYDYNGAADTVGYAQHTAYNALVKGTSVCDGYAKAYLYLLGRCGIQASMVTSNALNHAWNIVQLDGDWYETDVTFDDSGDHLRHTYFNLTTAAMTKAHGGSRDNADTNPLLPTANGTKYSYDKLTGGSTPTPTPTQTPTPTAQPGYGTGVEGFVTRLYEVCLDRSPDSAGLADWVNKLKSHTASGAQVAYGFVFSNEFKGKNYCNEDYVKQLYRAFLGRESDSAGLADWVGKLESGSTREEVFNGFSQSNEFKGICSEYGITLGDPIAIPQYGTVPTGSCSVCGEPDGVTAFVTRLYDICLDRKPDASGLKDWTNQLWNHSNSGRGVAFGFIFSDEFQGKNYDNGTYVDYLYKAFLGRNSDPAGKADWLNRMAQGWTREQIFDGFVGSDEFTGICQSYGIVRG